MDAALLAQQGFRGDVTVGILRDTFDGNAVRIHQAMARDCPQIHLTGSSPTGSGSFRHILSFDLWAVYHSFRHLSQAFIGFLHGCHKIF